MNELTIILNDDGTISLDATKMKGKDEKILAELKSLAASVGGDLTVEKHVGHHHAHHHDSVKQRA